jgi:hypothetical protein
MLVGIHQRKMNITFYGMRRRVIWYIGLKVSEESLAAKIMSVN